MIIAGLAFGFWALIIVSAITQANLPSIIAGIAVCIVCTLAVKHDNVVPLAVVLFTLLLLTFILAFVGKKS